MSNIPINLSVDLNAIVNDGPVENTGRGIRILSFKVDTSGEETDGPS